MFGVKHGKAGIMPSYPLRACMVVVIAITLVLSFAAASLALSTGWAENGVPVCTAPGNQYSTRIVPDGSGGVIFAWIDKRGEPTYQIFAQKLNRDGQPQWGADGVAVCANLGTAGGYTLSMCPDGSGGAIITWDDDHVSAGSWQVYAQRVDSGGSVKWTGGGVVLCTTASNKTQPVLTADSEGGAIIVWEDGRDDAPQSDLYAQRVDSIGTIRWSAAGQPVCTVPGADQIETDIVPDGTGGAVIGWRDGRVWQTQIYVQKLNSNGAAQWTVNGVHVCATAAADQLYPNLLPDGSGGAMLAWRDEREGFNKYDVYASRVDTGGAVIWDAEGLKICDVPGDQSPPQIITDGAGGAIITWDDPRNGNYDIYGQRVTPAGVVQWAANGKAISVQPTDQSHMITSDGIGGAIVAWQENRTGVSNDIYALHVDGNGDPMGAADGILVCGQETDQGLSNITAVNTNAAVIGWRDSRNGNNDIFAQKVSEGASTFYFAEGTTRTNFQEYLCMGNSGDQAASAKVTYLFTDGTTKDASYSVPANSRYTVNVNSEVGPNNDLSLKVLSDSPNLVAERPMYFNYNGIWTGGHDAVGATAPNTRWYFAEGNTLPEFDQYVTVLNPGNAAANLKFHYMVEGEGEKLVTGQVGPHSRGTFKTRDQIGDGKHESLYLESDQPVVAERPMYFNYLGLAANNWTGGHDVVGTNSPAKDWYFAEGTTRKNSVDGAFEQWLCLQNPGTTPLTVTATYQLAVGQGDPISKSYTVPAQQRFTLSVNNEIGPDKDCSVYLHSDSAFIAERPMYFSYHTSAWTGGHDVLGVNSTATTWFFAEGTTRDNFEEWLCLQNPGNSDAHTTISYYPASGQVITKQWTVKANTRLTVSANSDVGANLDISTRVSSDNPIIVERPMYFDYNGWTGGHDVVGFVPSQ